MRGQGEKDLFPWRGRDRSQLLASEHNSKRTRNFHTCRFHSNQKPLCHSKIHIK